MTQLTPNVSTYTDTEGRDFHYSIIDNQSNKLVIHFTAFFGDWGDRKEYKKDYKGYFHRFRMFSEIPDYNFLFLCDQFGTTQNGTYYTGKSGDFFVERATQHIINQIVHLQKIRWENIITIGSSMGATAAIKFGLLNHAKGIIAIAPHIDLDICAKYQGREPHVAWICPDGNTQAQHNFIYTRQIRNILANSATNSSLPLPRLFLHASEDDHGVYQEQVLPFIKTYRDKGGIVDFYSRKDGGHSGDFCGQHVIKDVLECQFSNQSINIKNIISLNIYLKR